MQTRTSLKKIIKSTTKKVGEYELSKEEIPNREKAYLIFEKHRGGITNRAIAKELNVNEKTVSVWKYRYNWKERMERSTKPKKRSTSKELSLREKQRKRIIEALTVANSYSPALDILIDVYLDCYEEYEMAKKEDMETESLRKELARLLRDLGLDISNRNMTMKKVESKKDKPEKVENKLLQFRKQMTK